jgi:hypothetical protein
MLNESGKMDLELNLKWECREAVILEDSGIMTDFKLRERFGYNIKKQPTYISLPSTLKYLSSCGLCFS